MIALVEGIMLSAQIHFPFPTYPQNILAAGLQEAMDLGLVCCRSYPNFVRGLTLQTSGTYRPASAALYGLCHAERNRND